MLTCISQLPTYEIIVFEQKVTNVKQNLIFCTTVASHHASSIPNHIVLTAPQLRNATTTINSTLTAAGIGVNVNLGTLQTQLQQQQHPQFTQQQQQQIIHQMTSSLKSNSNVSTVRSNTSTAVVVAPDQLTMSLNSQSGIDKFTSNDNTTILIGNSANPSVIVNAVTAALQNKHRRRPQQNDSNK